MPESILIVEDEPALRDTLSYNLKKDGFTVEAVGDASVERDRAAGLEDETGGIVTLAYLPVHRQLELQVVVPVEDMRELGSTASLSYPVPADGQEMDAGTELGQLFPRFHESRICKRPLRRAEVPAD